MRTHTLGCSCAASRGSAALASLHMRIISIRCMHACMVRATTPSARRAGALDRARHASNLVEMKVDLRNRRLLFRGAFSGGKWQDARVQLPR